MIVGGIAGTFNAIQGLPPSSQAILGVLLGAMALGLLLIVLWPKNDKSRADFQQR